MTIINSACFRLAFSKSSSLLRNPKKPARSFEAVLSQLYNFTLTYVCVCVCVCARTNTHTYYKKHFIINHLEVINFLSVCVYVSGSVHACMCVCV